MQRSSGSVTHICYLAREDRFSANKSLPVLHFLMSRVALYIKKTLSSADCRLAQFGQCIVDFFEFGDVGFGHVGLIHEENRLILYGLASDTQDEGVLLRHAWLCPVHQWEAEDLQNTSQEIKDKGVGIGVAILLTSSDNHVLITRRADHMRTFPGVWVNYMTYFF